MTPREIQAALILVVSIGTIAVSLVDILTSPRSSRAYVFVRWFTILAAGYIGWLYLISVTNQTQIIFGPGGQAMEYFRPGVLLIVAALLVTSVWMYRERR